MKRALAETNEASEWSLRQELLFLYDGWNMIAKSSRGTGARWTDGTADCPAGARARVERPNQLDVASNGVARLHRSYARGLDASGTLTGAGGVGGLVLTSHHTPQAGGGTQVTTLAPLYDFNGNVLAYANVATSTITHRMEYDPFGQELRLDTPLPGDGAAEAPRFRFSTKYTDGETGLVYYGFRFYSPDLGRWVNRDPIQERGGLNLYGMVSNDPVSRIDRLGLKWAIPAEAVTAACDAHFELSARNQIEYGGLILRCIGQTKGEADYYTYSSVKGGGAAGNVGGSVSGEDIRDSEYTEEFCSCVKNSAWHTHPKRGEPSDEEEGRYFSDGDVAFAGNQPHGQSPHNPWNQPIVVVLCAPNGKNYRYVPETMQPYLPDGSHPGIEIPRPQRN